jgi:N-methylhydantoinase A
MRAAIDVGGTFTDVLLYDDNTGELWSEKVSSSPNKPSTAFMSGLYKVLQKAKRDYSEVDLLIHGTTIVTNVLLEGDTARIGLLVTKGFRDLLEIGRQQRPDLYDLMIDRPTPLVPRNQVLEIEERVGADGEVVVQLNEEDAQCQIDKLSKMEIDSLAVVLLFSFKYPDHEEKLKNIARRILPTKFVFLSSEISPEFREYERASTTVVAAAVAPSVTDYLTTLQANIQNEARDREKTLLIMHSGGGTVQVHDAVKKPHSLVQSGPAAGVIASARLARFKSVDQCIAFDMGGTTAKAGLVLDGKPQYTTEYEVGGAVHQSRTRLGRGYPIRFPMIDLVECGAGAGSIAWIDTGGHLKVGPQSAGANPGPACYGKGGKLPTVTDAYLTLGYLSPHSFLGGELELHMEKSVQAIEEYIATPLNLTTENAAKGIFSIVNANMLRILRVVSVARGHDPRHFTLFAYGGAGPIHACALADELSINPIVVPRFPGFFSAMGLLNADITMDFVKTVMISLKQENLEQLNFVQRELLKEAEEWFLEIGVQPKERSLQFSADMRYLPQNYELNLPIPDCPLSVEDVSTTENRFHEAHEMAYGQSSLGEIIQIVNLRILAIKHLSKPTIADLVPPRKSLSAAFIETRKVIFPKGRVPCRIYERSMLDTGHKINGPAIIQEKEATTVLYESWCMRADKNGNMVINRNN